MNAILAWVKAVLDCEAIFAPSEGPRPARPYATVEVLSEGPVGTPSSTAIDDGGEDGLCELTVDSHRRGTFSVSIYADDHRDKATQLELSLADPATQEGLDEAGVVVVWVGGATEYNRVSRPTSFETFSVIDFEFGRVATRTSRTPVIETVEVSRDE
jgi:hypothetical protein